MTIKGHFNVPIYNCYVNIILTDNLMRVINIYLKRHKQELFKSEPGAFAFNPDDDSSNYYLFFQLKDVTANYFNHEKSHIIDFILEDRGIKKEDEARAFLDGFVSDKITKFFKKKKIKIK